MNIVECTQLSPEWFAARLGYGSASHADDMVAKSGSKGRIDYALKLAWERHTGELSEPGYLSPEMQYGIDNEPMAIAAFEATGYMVERVGFVKHPSIPWLGCSPDGLIVGEKALIQVKCPKASTHKRYWYMNEMPKEYFAQCTLELAVCEYDVCYFVSYRHDVVPHLFVYRFEPTKKAISALETECEVFLSEIPKIVDRLKTGEK